MDILSTKLHIPAPPRYLVPRGSLTARLEAGKRGKLILLSAPAGFGKTSLAAEWASRRGEEHLLSWVHLDEGDNEIVRFLSYLIAAIQIHQKHLGEAALSGLQAMPPAPLEAALTSLINDIDSSKRELILVLDDYHLIEAAPIHEAVIFLIEHLPAQVCLLIATRADPPLALHRLRARGQLTEIRAEELRFSSDETRSLMEGMLGMTFSAGDLAALDNRVEGWAAGLQMVALSMQGKQDIPEFIHSFSDSHRYLMDYLSEEIFYQQPHHIQQFLLQTSILDRFSSSLCEAALGAEIFAQREQGEVHPAQVMLEHLERANLFLLPLDNERQWYRYHNLFANLLRQRLRQTLPGEIRGLQQRACAWCAANGYIEEAIQYALSAKEVQTAAQLVQDHAMEWLNRGKLSTLLGWLSKLPEQTILAGPWLCVYFGWALLLSGKIEATGPYLAAAERGQISQGDINNLGGHIAAIRAYALAMQGAGEQAIVQANAALGLLPEDNLSVRSVVAYVLGGVHYMRRDFPMAFAAMSEAGKDGERAGNVHLAVSALSAAGDLSRNLGNLTEAEKIYQHALKLGTGGSGRPLPIAASVYASLAVLHLARNDLEKARQCASTGVELGKQWGNMDSLASNYLALADVLHLEGNSAKAKAALEQAKSLAAAYQLTPGTSERIRDFETRLSSGQPGGFVPGALVEALSGRELEVLKLMAEGRSNPEIAAELIVAVGTVKAHTSSIYRKLDVRSRTEAVIRAQELKLL